MLANNINGLLQGKEIHSLVSERDKCQTYLCKFMCLLEVVCILNVTVADQIWRDFSQPITDILQRIIFQHKLGTSKLQTYNQASTLTTPSRDMPLSDHFQMPYHNFIVIITTVHRDQLQAQRLVTSMGSLYLFFNNHAAELLGLK